MNRLAGAALLFGSVARRAIRRRRTCTLADRLAALPRKGWPVSAPVTIRWDDHHIPFVAAQTDDDLAVALGAVHAHLRLGQLEVARLLSQGRLAEMIGPLGVAADRLIRTLDMGRAVPEIERQLPDDTRRWLEGFVRGINHYLMAVEKLPEEFALFGLKRAPWRVADILTLGRFVGADVTWMVKFPLLRLRPRPDWPQLWRRLIADDVSSSVSPAVAALPRFASLALTLSAAVRAGSNCFAVSGSRTASGAPLLASDPHLPLMLPGPWLIAAFKSPSYNAAGLMIPGIPFVALGRNPWIAWGGTSLHAASSDLVIVPEQALSQIRAREAEIPVRWSRPRRIRLRDSPWGPIMSDIPLLRSGSAVVALRWIGHRGSDEVTAMLRASRAQNESEFREALDGFAIPSQNMLCADTSGHIGKLMAAHLPCRNLAAAPELAIAPGPGDGWDAIATGKDLPSERDPAAGFLASANERPGASDIVIGFHFSPPDRRRRLDALLSSQSKLSVGAAAGIQRDVHWTTALGQRDQILSWIDALTPVPRHARKHRLIAELRAWDGDYAVDSRGALAFELLSYHLARRLVPSRQRRLYRIGWGSRGRLWHDIAQAAPAARERALRHAVHAAARTMPHHAAWGDFHRLRLGHPLALLPIVGRAYRIAELAIGGGTETLMKTAHALTARRHASRFGSTARHISDLADLDRNYLVLIGGQDGWFGSSTLDDQVTLWRRGDYIQVPLRPETAASLFAHRTDLAP